MPNRQACEAVLFRARTGCPWRDLPAAYGPWHTIYMRWRRWVDAGSVRSRHFFVCGVGSGVLAIRDLLRRAGYERRSVRYEQW